MDDHDRRGTSYTVNAGVGCEARSPWCAIYRASWGRAARPGVARWIGGGAGLGQVDAADRHQSDCGAIYGVFASADRLWDRIWTFDDPNPLRRATVEGLRSASAPHHSPMFHALGTHREPLRTAAGILRAFPFAERTAADRPGEYARRLRTTFGISAVDDGVRPGKSARRRPSEGNLRA